MKKTALSLMFLLALAPAARAQVGIRIDIGLPPAPPLVVVQPGIQVVEGFREEVFFSAGWYWCRRPDGWYRARGPRERFAWVEARRVPPGLVRLPAGHYRNWHHEGHADRGRHEGERFHGEEHGHHGEEHGHHER